MARNYKNIRAWTLSRAFTLEIYKSTKKFPKEELYGMTSQIRRAGVSIVANIAEGASRQHKKDYLNFLYISKASLSEVECLLDLSFDLKYLDILSYEGLRQLHDDAAKSLYGLIKSVESEIR